MSLDTKDKRKTRRRPMRYSAWIALEPGKFHGCVLSDISDKGARIDVEDETVIPDRFPLFLSRNGGARRVCTVAWRKPKQIGVAFTARFSAADRAKLVENIEARVASPPTAPTATGAEEGKKA
ncbi:MAG TPA: PilZ domain-containing protein [Pseudolabrys sp.]|nr:PilZ domain-containing protein [Pseudolabrys sp.]